MQTTLVIFSGLPGTGKSTLADKLARDLRWPLLRIDDVVGEVPENPGLEFWDSKVELLLDLVNTQLELGLSVIADSVFMNMDRQYAQEIARANHARFRPVYVFVSDDGIWEQRVTRRYNELKDKDVATWDRIQHQRARFREWEAGTALFLDSIAPVEQNYDRLKNFVSTEEVKLRPLDDVPLVEGKYH
jgi:predicted kinase